MNFFLRHLRANRSGTLIMLALQCGLCLMGIVMVLIINATLNEDNDYAAIGSTMALMGTIFGGLLRGAGAPVRYRMAVSMGHTRRGYMLADPLITAMNCLIGVAAAWGLSKLELLLYGALYPGWSCEFDLMGVFRWQWVLLLVVLVVVADYCLGALQLRFGTKGFLAIWCPLCFAPMLITSSANAAGEEGNASLFAQIGRGIVFVIRLLTPAMWAAVGAAVVLALVALSTLCYRRAEVRI